MASLRPDPSFYTSPRMAMKAPPEKLAYVVAFDPKAKKPDTLSVVDVDPASASYGSIRADVAMPNKGDELHHFGWNACSSCLCPNAPHPHVERRYLIVPGLRSSRIHVIDVKANGIKPEIVRVIEPEEIAERTGYSRVHTIHCGPEGIYVSALGAPDGGGPGGIFLMDHETFEVRGRWEVDRGPQVYAYDFWWHLGDDTLMTSEWGTPDMVENGIVPEKLLAGEYGHHIHFFDLHKRKHVQALDLGAEHQMALELRPAHDPTKFHGFCGVVISTADLSGSIWTWYKDGNQWAAKKIITIPAQPADPDQLPDLLKGFSAVPPLITDIDLSLDDRFLYVSCWGTGEFHQYDVSDPFNAKLTGKITIGGIAGRAAHPSQPDRPLSGAPQMLEISRDGKRVYFTSSLYGAWDKQFYPDGLDGWMVKVDVDTKKGGMKLDERFFLEWPGGLRPHQIRLEGGDCSSDSYCYP